MNKSTSSSAFLNKATVIIPCFNVEDYIKECLDSVVQQEGSVHHTYVVDNNSTDSTWIKVREWQTANPSIPLTLLAEEKPGAPAARNKPLHLVKTKWIQFLDADDLLLPGKIEEQIDQFPTVDVICAATKHLATDGSERTALPLRETPLALIKGSAGITSSNLFSTSAVVAVNGWDTALKSSQEYDLMFRLWKTGATFDVDLRPRTIIRARQSGQISQRNASEKWTQLIDLRQTMLSTFLQLELDDSTLAEMKQSLFAQIRTLANHNLQEAIIIFENCDFMYEFTPRVNNSITSGYVRLFRLIGFRRTEEIRRWTKEFF